MLLKKKVQKWLTLLCFISILGASAVFPSFVTHVEAAEYPEISIELIPGKLTFTDTNSKNGIIEGDIQWRPVSPEQDIVSYMIYYLDSQNRKIEFIAEEVKGDFPPLAYGYSLTKKSIHPKEATQIGVFVRTAKGVAKEGAKVPLEDRFSLSIYPRFYDTDPGLGKINARVTWQVPDGDSDIAAYVISFVDGTGQALGTFEKIPVDSPKMSSWITTNSIPKGAASIKVQAQTTSGALLSISQTAPLSDNISGVPLSASLIDKELQAPKIASFSGSYENGTHLTGDVSVSVKSEDPRVEKYRVYFVDGQGNKVGGLLDIPAAALKDKSVEAYIRTIPYPDQAVALGAYAVSSEGESETGAIGAIWPSGYEKNILPSKVDVVSVDGVNVTVQWARPQDESRTAKYEVELLQRSSNGSAQRQKVGEVGKDGRDTYSVAVVMEPKPGYKSSELNVYAVNAFGQRTTQWTQVALQGQKEVKAEEPAKRFPYQYDPNHKDTRPMAPEAPSRTVADPMIQVFVDGDKVSFDYAPFIEEGSTMVQFRPIFEKLGLQIQWMEETRSIIGVKQDHQIKLTIGKTEAEVAGRTSLLSVAPRIVNDVTVVPLRFVGEATGRKVIWDEKLRAVYIIDSQTEGKIHYPNGQIMYEGQLKDGQMHGKGKMYRENGKLWYDAEFRNNQVQGLGTWVQNGYVDGLDQSGYYIIGHIEQGVPDGPRQAYTPDGKMIYEGDFKVGMNGKGTYYEDGKILYEGEFASGKYQGYGKLYVKGYLMYEGEFKQNEWNGKGKIYNPYFHWLYYEGELKDGKMHGQGTYYTSDTHYYKGSFVNGVKEGKGTDYIAGVVEYEGDYHNNKREGKGKKYDDDNRLYEGEFKDNVANGKGKLTDKNGQLVYEGEFVDGKPLNLGTHK